MKEKRNAPGRVKNQGRDYDHPFSVFSSVVSPVKNVNTKKEKKKEGGSKDHLFSLLRTDFKSFANSEVSFNIPIELRWIRS